MGYSGHSGQADENIINIAGMKKRRFRYYCEEPNEIEGT
jgi:hypothetical protein